MHKRLAEAQDFARSLAGAEPDPRIQRFVAPPFTVVREVKSMLRDSSVMVGAQNMHWEDQGAWTGEVSAPMLVDCGLDLVVLGHSERRTHFGETDASVGRKVAAAARHGLRPLICVGEGRQERDAGTASEFLRMQVDAALAFLDEDQIAAPILFAYEPRWAIGHGGVPAAPDYADARLAEIAAVARDRLGRAVPCLYGGSVDAGNCVDLVRQPHVDGLFVGRAAWRPEGYLEILDRCAAAL